MHIGGAWAKVMTRADDSSGHGVSPVTGATGATVVSGVWVVTGSSPAGTEVTSSATVVVSVVTVSSSLPPKMANNSVAITATPMTAPIWMARLRVLSRCCCFTSSSSRCWRFAF